MDVMLPDASSSKTMRQASDSAALFFVLMYVILCLVALNILGGLVWLVYQSTLETNEDNASSKVRPRASNSKLTCIAFREKQTGDGMMNLRLCEQVQR
jgi:nitrate reductase NapE component